MTHIYPSLLPEHVPWSKDRHGSGGGIKIGDLCCSLQCSSVWLGKGGGYHNYVEVCGFQWAEFTTDFTSHIKSSYFPAGLRSLGEM